MSDRPTPLARYASILEYALGLVCRGVGCGRLAPAVVSHDRADNSAGRDGTAEQQRLVDAAVAAYVGWRAACTAVHDTYRSWVRAPAADAELAYTAYVTRLDREQVAAETYGRLMAKVGHLVESGLDYPLTATLWPADDA
jgi:hypothetical protein